MGRPFNGILVTILGEQLMGFTTNFIAFFDYLNSCHEAMTSEHPQAEFLYLGDFNVHHREWLKSSHMDVKGVEALTFSILNDLEQIITHPTHISDRHDHTTNTLDLSFTSNPLHYNNTISPPIGCSDHILVNITFLTTTSSHLTAPTKRQYWHFNSTDWTGLRNFFSDFPLERLLPLLG